MTDAGQPLIGLASIGTYQRQPLLVTLSLHRRSLMQASKEADIMRNTYKKNNHTQKGDFTKQDKTRYLMKHCLFADYVKIINDTTGLFDLLADPKLDVLDKRSKKNIEYSFHFIAVIGALVCCLGIFVSHTFASAFIEPCALENVSCLTNEDTSIVIDYKALNSAISKMDDVSWIEGLAQNICEKMHRSGRYRKYYKWYGLPVVIDATDFAFFKSFHCIHDLTATFHKGTKDETTYYFHKALVARVFFTKTISFPIGIEFIENQEKSPSKQDCENEAAIRLLKRIKQRFPLLLFIICGDGLYANKTFIQLCIGYEWNYLFTLKDGCQPSLCGEFRSMVQKDLTHSVKVRYDEETGIIYWANDMNLIVNASLPMNILCYQTTMIVSKGKKKARGIQNAVLRRKDIDQNIPELSKDQTKYNLDERVPGKKARKQSKDAAKKTEKSDKAREDLAKINPDLASKTGDGEISGSIKEGSTIEVSFMYITNIPISKENVGELLVRGRARWMIEETFLREKVGAQRLEHLRSKDPMVMKFYFWMECIADSCMQIYLDYSKALKVYGSEEEVYRKLRGSFERDSLKDNYDTGRECHWHYEDERNIYPTVEILPDDEHDPKKGQQQDKKDTAQSGIGPEKKPSATITMAVTSHGRSEEKDPEETDQREEVSIAEKKPQDNNSGPETYQGDSSSQTEGARISGGQAKTGKAVFGRDDIGHGVDRGAGRQPEDKDSPDTVPVTGSSETDDSVTAAFTATGVAATGTDDDVGDNGARTGPQSWQSSGYSHGILATKPQIAGYATDGPVSASISDRGT